MANVLQKIFTPSVDEVVQNFTIQSWHVSQSVDALTGAEAYDITISGSLVVTGSVAINGLSNTIQNNVLTYDDATGLIYYTASSNFNVNNFYTSSITQSITSSTVNNTINNSTINQTIISSSVNTPAPSEYYIQYNSASTFGASADFQYIYPNQSLQHGFGVEATGPYSYAHGDVTHAGGFGSHAEGSLTSASANYSHAEGRLTKALSIYSHAEGQQTVSSGPYSHAEGLGTQASNTGSHAEGQNTIASANYAHAEGFSTTAMANFAHAEGAGTIARGIGSHAEGLSTIAQGMQSHAEGVYTWANAAQSHAEGAYTTSSGIYSHAEGESTYASGQASHAEGYLTIASANYSHAEGLGTWAGGDYQHVQGRYNLLSSNQSAFIIGNGTSNASRSNLVFASGSTFQVTGSVNLTQNLTVGGGYRPNTKSVDPSSDPALLVTDHVVFAAPSGVGGQISLPSSPVTNMQIVIMRTELTNAFTVEGNGNLINGSATYSFPPSAYTRKTFTFFAGRWWVESN
jgi:hypothetical protein